MTTDKKKLRELAGAATPVYRNESYDSKTGEGFVFHATELGHEVARFEHRKDAQFYVSANPQAVIELLDEIEGLRGALKEISSIHERYEDPALKALPTMAIVQKALKSNPDDAEVG